MNIEDLFYNKLNVTIIFDRQWFYLVTLNTQICARFKIPFYFQEIVCHSTLHCTMCLYSLSLSTKVTLPQTGCSFVLKVILRGACKDRVKFVSCKYVDIRSSVSAEYSFSFWVSSSCTTESSFKSPPLSLSSCEQLGPVMSFLDSLSR